MTKLEQAHALRNERCSLSEIAAACGWSRSEARQYLTRGYPKSRTRRQRQAKLLNRLVLL